MCSQDGGQTRGHRGEPNAPGLWFSFLLSFHILALVLFLRPPTRFLPRVLSQMNDAGTRPLPQEWKTAHNQTRWGMIDELKRTGTWNVRAISDVIWTVNLYTMYISRCINTGVDLAERRDKKYSLEAALPLTGWSQHFKYNSNYIGTEPQGGSTWTASKNILISLIY